MNETKRSCIRTTECTESVPNRLEHIQKILNLMAFQSKMPSNPFVDKTTAYDAAGCGPRASMYIFAH